MAAALRGFDRVEEVPVRIRRRAGSTIHMRAVGGILLDVLAIWWRMRVRHRYRAGP